MKGEARSQNLPEHSVAPTLVFIRNQKDYVPCCPQNWPFYFFCSFWSERCFDRNIRSQLSGIQKKRELISSCGVTINSSGSTLPRERSLGGLVRERKRVSYVWAFFLDPDDIYLGEWQMEKGKGELFPAMVYRSDFFFFF